MFAGNLVITIVIASQSERCSRQLASSVAFMISSHHMSEMERQSALVFLYNIQANTLTARPCDLYDISYSLLLQMFSVVVAYSVIILQSAWLLVCWSDMVLCRPAFKYKTNQCQMEYIIHGGTITVTRIFISDFHLSFNKIIIYIFLRWSGAAACWWRPRWPRLNAHSLTDHCEPKKCNGARDIH